VQQELDCRGVAGAFFLRRQGRLREKRNRGRAAELVLFCTDCDRREAWRSSPAKEKEQAVKRGLDPQRWLEPAKRPIREKWPQYKKENGVRRCGRSGDRRGTAARRPLELPALKDK
jgi:hypothetical protein